MTYQGKPVEGALVTFLNQENVLGSGTTDAAGKYTISTLGKAGATMGKHQVAITKTSGGSTATSGSGARSGPPSPEEIKKLQDDMKSGMAGSKTTELLPAKYANPAQSGFTVDVKAGNATFDFTLTD